jgi:iron complex transport system ATP-binding protein
MTMLHCDGLSIGYRQDRPVATGITLTAEHGEFICLLGRNGVGKSTLLRTIAGLHPALAGTVHLDGHAIASMTASARARRIALVLTERVDAPGMTALDVVESGRLPFTPWLGALTREDHDIVNDALGMAQASDLRHQLMAELSDGQRQRVMIARALAQTPRLLVLDEITAFLDLPSRVAMMATLRTLARERGIVVLLSSHDLDLSLQLADRIWLMPGDGSIRDGTPEALALDGHLSRTFDHPMMRFATESGTFRLELPPHAALIVTGDEPARFWSAHALSRHGIQPLAGTDADRGALRLNVRAAGSGWRWELDAGDSTAHATTLDEMTALVRRHLPPLRPHAPHGGRESGPR